MRSPVLPASPMEKSSSATPAPNMACGAIFRPTMRKLASWPGAFIPCPAILRRASNRKRWKPPPRPGAANGGRPAAAERHGKGSFTILRSICYISEPATRPPGIARCAAAETTLHGFNCRRARQQGRDSPGIFRPRPEDNWDFNSTQPLIQADLSIGGRTRKVIMQANKNGFFYVLDRATGEFISGAPFVGGITWATGLDPETGRPIEIPSVGQREARHRLAWPQRRTQLESHGFQPGYRAGVFSSEDGYACGAHARHKMEIQSRRQQYRR